MEYLSIEGEKKSLFDDLRSIFGWTKGGAIPRHEGRPVQDLDALMGSGPHSDPSIRFRCGRKGPGTEELRSEPSKGGRKRKGTGGPSRIRATPIRGARVSGKGLSTPGPFPSPPPTKHVRGKASTTSTLPPVTSSSALRVEPKTTAARLEVSGPTNIGSSNELARAYVMVEAATPPIASSPASRVELETVVAQPEVPSLTSFCLVYGPMRAPSSVVEAAMPPAASPIGSFACPSLSTGDFLCTFAEEGVVEPTDEVSSVEIAALEAPTPTVSKVE
ncbi:hypothetical protein AMTR_s00026p00135800 [Amborella trichopoda]|uniref:Uncharacterized protein n=1 Tax=Amborella trichopoda TaxID=13333 RepID=W1PK71_AMBTC|nr:hypothetical protein AMTR_s00026p00135800 [Amborella trichopoda]